MEKFNKSVLAGAIAAIAVLNSGCDLSSGNAYVEQRDGLVCRESEVQEDIPEVAYTFARHRCWDGKHRDKTPDFEKLFAACRVVERRADLSGELLLKAAFTESADCDVSTADGSLQIFRYNDGSPTFNGQVMACTAKSDGPHHETVSDTMDCSHGASMWDEGYPLALWPGCLLSGLTIEYAGAGAEQHDSLKKLCADAGGSFSEKIVVHWSETRASGKESSIPGLNGVVERRWIKAK